MRTPLIAVILLHAVPAAADRPVHTFSIVARDPVTGDLGVAVQSHWFSVGAVVTWAEPGVGAVATQSFVEQSYGPLGLTLMRAGKGAKEALEGLVAADAGRDVRQVAFVDATGQVATHTGKSCIAAAGHEAGESFSVQANMMEKPTVWPAMAKAYRNTKGDLAERMLAALDAAEAEGGDIRGRQSAAILIVSGKPSGKPWAGRLFDLRVDDHPKPLVELRRLVKLQRAYNHMNAGDLAVEHKDNEAALREYKAAAALVPDNDEMVYWHAVALVGMGKTDDAMPMFKKLFAKEPRWRELTRRLPASGLMPEEAARKIAGK